MNETFTIVICQQTATEMFLLKGIVVKKSVIWENAVCVTE